MKKLFAIAFTCVYLTLTVGVVRTTHYCMGRVKSTSLFSFQSVKCACAVISSPMSKKCCDDEHDLIKIDDDQSASHIVSITPDFFEIGKIFEVIEAPVSAVSHSIATFNSRPPPVNSVPLFTKHCSLVFYDDEMTA